MKFKLNKINIEILHLKWLVKWKFTIYLINKYLKNISFSQN
jgi:hypothetical protein